MQFFFIVSISMIAGGAAVGLYGRMSAKIHALSERIRKLEESQAKRLPYMSADAIEDLIATLNSEAFRMNFRQELIDNALAHAHKARNPNRK